MEETLTIISAAELKKVLFSIIRHELPVCIRYRTIGQLWHPNYLRIIKVEDNSAIVFHDETRKRLIFLPDVSAITQFEVDRPVHFLKAGYHYQVSDEIVA
jgi:hypothetical protein